jgi:fumarylacetoacetase
MARETVGRSGAGKMAHPLVPEDSDFPLSNLPLGSFETAVLGRRVGIAIGESILDCHALTRDGHLDGAWALGGSAQVINDHLALGAPAWAAARAAVQSMLALDTPMLRDLDSFRSKYLVAAADATLRMPVTVGDYTDFYLSLEHARNVGTMFRGADNALMDNWTCLPVAYHGRASTVVASGEADPRRPWGQAGKPDSGAAPVFRPSAQLDYELELG